MERVEPFVGRCEAFFELCHQPGGPPDARLRALTLLVAGLYADGLMLPAVQSEVRVHDVARVDFDTAFAAMAQAFPGLTNYWSCEQSLETSVPARAIVRDAVEDVTDLYLDLREGYEHWANGHTRHAVWHWRYMFQRHWGRVATRLQFALQELLEREGIWLD